MAKDTEMRRRITEEEIMACQTPRGGWMKADLADWGVPWPPPPGWKEALLKYGIPYSEDLSYE